MLNFEIGRITSAFLHSFLSLASLVVPSHGCSFIRSSFFYLAGPLWFSPSFLQGMVRGWGCLLLKSCPARVCVCVCVCLDVSGCTGSGLSFKPCHSLAPLLMKWWGQLCVCVCVCARISVFWCCLKLCVAILYTLRGTTTQRYRKRECVCVCGCVCESADAGERETRPAPSRVRPCAHKCFSEPQSTFTCFCVRVSLCVCVCVCVCVCFSMVEPDCCCLFFFPQASPSVSKGCRGTNTHICTRTLIHRGRMTEGKKDESGWQRQNESQRDKHSEGKWDGTLSGVCVRVCVSTGTRGRTSIYFTLLL